MARTPIHPGEILADELGEIGLSAAGLARLIDVPANRISQIVAGKRNLTADTALRLGRCFGTSADFWMNLQKAYELDRARAPCARAHLSTAGNRARPGRPPSVTPAVGPNATRAPACRPEAGISLPGAGIAGRVIPSLRAC
jgi:antitoxin HigA-1